jgi:hypothetical protein
VECIVDNVAKIINAGKTGYLNEVPTFVFGIHESRDYDISISASYRIEEKSLEKYHIMYSHPEAFDRELDKNPKSIIIGLHRDIRENVALATELLLLIMEKAEYQGNETFELSDEVKTNIDQEIVDYEQQTKIIPTITIKLEYPKSPRLDPFLYILFGSFLTFSIVGILTILYILLL